MALAAQVDVEGALGRQLTAAEASRVAGLLARTEAIVMGWLGCEAEPAPVPPALTATVAHIAARSLSVTITPGVEQVTADDTSVRYSTDAGGGPWLTHTDKLALRRFRCSGGMSSVQLVSDRYTITP